MIDKSFFLGLKVAGLETIKWKSKFKMEKVMPDNLGIKETKDMVLLLVKIGLAVKESLKDGKIDYKDLPYFTGIIFTLPAALTEMGKIPAELMDEITEAEQTELISEIVQSGLFEDNLKAKEIVNDALELAFVMWKFYKKHFIG